MKKILQIDNYMFPHIGGIEQTTRDVANSLKDEYEVKILCFNHEKGTIIDSVDGVPVTRVNCQTKIGSQSIALSFGKVLKKTLAEYKPDIVIFHYPNPFFASFLEKYLKNKKFKFILYWHLDITKQKILGKLFSGQNKRLLKYADKVIATSPIYIEGSPWLSKYKEKCVVVPSCINTDRLMYNESHINEAKKIKEKYNGKTICFAFGRHVQYKGISYLIQASKYLDDNYKILIGGKGPLTDDLKKEAKSDVKVEFLGKLSDDELKSCFLACDVFCFPSITKNEAFGLGLAEAMYYSKPCVTFNIPGSGVNFVSLNNVTGLEVENGNVESYACAIKEVLNHPEFGLNARNRVEELFTFDIFKTNIKKVINNL